MPPRRSLVIRRLFPQGEPNIARRAICLALAYLVVTGGLVAVLLQQLRTETIIASERELGALAQLTAGHTSEVILGVEQSLRLAEATLSIATDVGSADSEAIRAMLVDVIGAARGLQDIFVLDTQGRIVYSARGDGEVGLDRSSQPYFLQFLDNPKLKFDVGVPLRRTMHPERGEWFVPAAHSWRHTNGEFAGVIVGIIEPQFFDKAWTFDTEMAGISIGLAGPRGTLIMRRPFVAEMIGRSMGNGETAAQLASNPAAINLQIRNTVDGQARLLAYRRIAAYPHLYSFVAQPVGEVLAGWRRIAWIGGSSWLFASLALGGLGVWLARVLKARGVLESRYHALFDSIPYPVIVSDFETRRILALNDAATRQYEWSRKEVFANNMGTTDLFSPQATEPADARATSSTEATQAQQHRKRDGAKIDIETTMRRIEYDRKPAVLTIAVDIGDRLRMERARQAAEEQLRRAQKMDVLGQLTGGIAHDFNNILTVIMDNTDVLLEEIDADPATLKRLGSIADSTRRAEDLTRQMLAFSRKQPLRPRPTNINDLVVDTGKLLRRTLGAQIEIDSVLKDDLWTVEIDRSQLETALVKLCLNARDAMPTGGRLLIETQNATIGKNGGDPGLSAPPGDYVLLIVSDLGSGYATSDLDKVFEPFFTTKDGDRGTGLGLSMVYGFVKQSNGYIEVQSELGQGTSFKLYLPRYQGKAKETPVAQKSALVGGVERLLVVEDDDQVRASVVHQLKTLGYSVFEAVDGTTGLAAFEATPQPFDLLLTDVMMPGPLNGKDLADVVARRWPVTRTVFMSGYTDNVLTRDGQLDSDIRLLNKPFRKSDLAAIVRQALADGPARVPA